MPDPSVNPKPGDDTTPALKRGLEAWGALPGNVRGACWVILAAAGFSVMVALIKIAGRRLPIGEILLFRQAFMLMFMAPVLVRGFPSALRTQQHGLHSLRIIAALFGMLFGFTAFIHMPLADATTIGFARSFFITILAVAFLNESVGARRWLAIGVGFIGVAVVLRPGPDIFTQNIYGVMALAGACSAALVMVLIRKLSQRDKPSTILLYQALGVGALIAPLAIWNWVTPSLEDLVLLLAIGAVSVVAQMANIHAYRAGEASVMAGLDYIRLLYAVALGFVLFGEWPDIYVFAGAGIIIAAALYTIHREARLGRRLARSEESRAVAP